MLSDRKTAFWIVVTLIVALFFVFVLMAVFVKPDMGVSDIVREDIRLELEALREAVWWTTLASFMLPIMMMLIALAIYLFITGNPAGAPVKAAAPAAPKKGGLFGMVPGVKPKKAEPASTFDVLDLRYARGEITREQYLAMKEDLKVNQASQAPQAQQPQM
jgi:uncharacterized membrane protein